MSKSNMPYDIYLFVYPRVSDILINHNYFSSPGWFKERLYERRFQNESDHDRQSKSSKNICELARRIISIKFIYCRK